MRLAAAGGRGGVAIGGLTGSLPGAVIGGVIGASLGVAGGIILGDIVGNLVFNGNTSDDAESPQDKRLSPGEIGQLEEAGYDVHDLKPNSKYDLFKDRDGNISVKPKDGSGPGDPTGINLGELQ